MERWESGSGSAWQTEHEVGGRMLVWNDQVGEGRPRNQRGGVVFPRYKKREKTARVKTRAVFTKKYPKVLVKERNLPT